MQFTAKASLGGLIEELLKYCLRIKAIKPHIKEQVYVYVRVDHPMNNYKKRQT
jgi:hypothetical protein